MKLLSPPAMMAHLGHRLYDQAPMGTNGLRDRRRWCEANFTHPHRFIDGPTTIDPHNGSFLMTRGYSIEGDVEDLVLFKLRWLHDDK